MAASGAPAASVSVQHSPHQDVPLRSAHERGKMKRSVRCFVCYSFPVCVSVCLALRLAVWCGVNNLLLSHHLLSLPKCFNYVRNAASPNVLFYFFAAPPGAAVRRGVAEIFQIFLFLPAVQILSMPSAPADYDVLHVRSIL